MSNSPVTSPFGLRRPEVAASRSYVTLGAGTDIFAVEVEYVREILGLRVIKPLPNGPEFLAGLIDVRGDVVPVIDLRAKLGMPSRTDAASESTRILVLDFNIEGRPEVLGLMVDQVFEVTEMRVDEIKNMPEFGTHWNAKYIKGVFLRSNEFIIIFNLEKLFSEADVVSLKNFI